MPRTVTFGAGRGLGAAQLGIEGARLDGLASAGLPVAPGFTVAATAALDVHGLRAQVRDALRRVESAVGARFGAGERPLLADVRASAALVVPGIAPAVENVGLRTALLPMLGEELGDVAATEALARLVRVLARDTVVPAARFDDALMEHAGAAPRDRLDAMLAVVEAETGASFPEDPVEQVMLAIRRAHRMWGLPRSVRARTAAGAPDDLALAVHVQARVMPGPRRASQRISSRSIGNGRSAGGPALDERFPALRGELEQCLRAIEREVRDAVDVQVDVDGDRFWLVGAAAAQATRPGDAVRTVVALAQEGIITRGEAVSRIGPGQLEHLLHPRLESRGAQRVAVTGLGASPGAASGRVALSSRQAETLVRDGQAAILVRIETTPDDLPGMHAADGVLTAAGGLTSHAAIVARGIGKPAVCGTGLEIDAARRTVRLGDLEVAEGDDISIDGSTGAVVVGELPIVAPKPSDELRTLLEWADGIRRLRVRANADTPHDVAIAVEHGAEGVGLCRTEHQFLGARLPLVQRLILAGDPVEEQAALDALAAAQKEDFRGLLAAVDGRPITIRLLDPPLHEFLPRIEELMVDDALDRLDEVGRALLRAAREWAETNPMLGTRGVRLALLKPALYPAQARALFEAAAEQVADGGRPQLEIMIPLVVDRREVAAIARLIREQADVVERSTGIVLDYRIGTMIETPRAALVAGEIATEAEFFSFGTNDLTQLTFGFSRDDVEARLMPHYLEARLLDRHPFQTLDASGVGSLLRTAVADGRASRPDLKIGICGEHGGDPASIGLCEELGLDYVSCSPYRVPVARLAAAQAVLDAPSGV